MDASCPITIRRARREDVAAIVRMLADDALGASRERLEEPLPPSYFQAFERVARDPNLKLVVAEQGGAVVGCLQLCILPGIYLGVAWIFTEALVIDKKLEFWPAMELSRKVVSRHW